LRQLVSNLTRRGLYHGAVSLERLSLLVGELG
jgi:hypothetical protein